MNESQKRMIEKYQCPGCVAGSDTECGALDVNYGQGYHSCAGHCCGTYIMGSGSMALGLPKGFNKCQIQWGEKYPRHNTIPIRLWTTGNAPKWDHLNVPVWALEKDGSLFVRTCIPRLGIVCVDVIDGGSIDMPSDAIDVGSFHSEID